MEIDFLGELKALYGLMKRSLQRAEEADNSAAIKNFAAEARLALELFGKVTGVLGSGGGVNVNVGLIERTRTAEEDARAFAEAATVLIRLDSEYTHEEIVKPALTLLHEHGFTAPLTSS